MNVLIPMVCGLALLFLATRTYAYYVANKLGVDDRNPTPARRLEDGRDYVPSRTHVVFGHHFATIAGASPIVGPTLALAFGYGPAWLWIILGVMLFGAVHDMTAMFVSMREDGRSIADMSRRALGKWGYLYFVVFVILILTLINAIFLNLSCKALTAEYPIAQLKLPADSTLIAIHEKTIGGQQVLVGRIGGIATTSVLIITLMAPLIGYLIHKRRWPITGMYVLAAASCVISVVIGFKAPIPLQENAWRYIMTGYVFVACWIPVWLVMQPRDFTNVQLLYGGLTLMALGLLIGGLHGQTISAEALAYEQGTRLVGPLWPALFITIACGAISGFHSIASTGTTVKQISSELDVRRVGYNAMILEGALALLTLMLISSALPAKEYYQIVYPPSGGGNPILAFAIAMGYMLNGAFGVPIAIGAVVGILVIEGFVVTTLDTAVRLCRYMLEELWLFVFAGRPAPIFRSALFNTAIAVGLMLFFALNSTIVAAWKIFGSGNQLIAALAMTVASVWLLQRGRSFWFALTPAVAMTATTFAMLGLFIVNNVVAGARGPFVVSAREKGPLVVAAVLLLVLAMGVTSVAARRFREAWAARHGALAGGAGDQGETAPAE